MPSPQRYIWQQPAWPALTFDLTQVTPALAAARRAQGEVEGKAAAIGLEDRGQVLTEVFEHEVIATAAIEGERLDPVAVRSSVLRQLGHTDTGPRDRHVDGLVEVLADATQGFDRPLDHDRLQRWQSALFPGGTSGIRRIAVGRYRDHPDPMQIVSGPPGRETIHYEAPPSAQVRQEMRQFLRWFRDAAPGKRHPGELDGLVRAAIAHLWFESIHPFEDGNGRVGRALVDMALAQDRGEPSKLYSLSLQLMHSRKDYYDALNQAQRGTGDVTDWVCWFVTQIERACSNASAVMDRAIEKQRFWVRHAGVPLADRHRKVLQRLLDAGDGGFLGGLNADKYIKMTGVSKATATRDLALLLSQGLLEAHGDGKARRYAIQVPGWTHGARDPWQALNTLPAHVPGRPPRAPAP